MLKLVPLYCSKFVTATVTAKLEVVSLKHYMTGRRFNSAKYTLKLTDGHSKI